MICGKCGARRGKTSEFFVHWTSDCTDRTDWMLVTQARQAGQLDQAERLARKAMGVEGPEMTEETKEKLRQYREEHKEEIAARAKLKRMTNQRLRMVARKGSK